jgi:plastocyanin
MKRVILALGILMALVATGASLAVEHSLAAYPKPVPARPAGAPVTTGTPTISPTPLGTPVLCPPEFQDVPANHPDYAYIHCAACQGSMGNFPCGQPGEPCVAPNNYPYFRPDGAAPGTRAELSKLIVTAAHWPVDTTDGPHFTDVPVCDPYYNYIETAYNRRVVAGWGCGGPGEPCPGIYFRPNLTVTRGQLAILIYNAFIHRGTTTPTPTPCAIPYTDVQPTDYFYVAVRFVTCAGIMRGYPDGTFRPYNEVFTMTRAEMAGVAARAFTDCSPAPPQVPSCPPGSTTPTPSPTPISTVTRTRTPTRLPTSMPNLWSAMAWQQAACPPDTLRLTTYSNSIPTWRSIGPSTMRLQDSAGDYQDFAVPGFYTSTYQSYSYDCAVGPCIPASWLASRPFTLTADYYNVITEFNEDDNTSVMTSPPPACGTFTPTATPNPNAVPVQILDFVFEPQTLVIGMGQTVRWTNHGISTHSSVSDTGLWDSGYLSTDQSFEFTFPRPGIYPYHCAVHPTTMTGTIKVAVLDPTPPNGSPSRTSTLTPTHTPTATPTATATATATYTPTAVFTQVSTGTTTLTPTNTPTITHTPTAAPTTTPCALNFSDVRAGDYFYDDVHCVYCRGAISGYADGTFRPFNNTTRGQMAKIVVLAFNIPGYSPSVPTFADVPITQPFYPFVEAAAHVSIVSGYNCGGPAEPCPGVYFRPGNLVTRAQLSKIEVVAAGWPQVRPDVGHFNDVPPANPFYGYVETAFCHQVIAGYSCGGPAEPCPGVYFRPGNSATRAQIARITCRVLSSLPCVTSAAGP